MPLFGIFLSCDSIFQGILQSLILPLRFPVQSLMNAGNLSVRSIAIAISSMRTLILSILINVFIVRVIFVYSLFFIRWRTIVRTVIFFVFYPFRFFLVKIIISQFNNYFLYHFPPVYSDSIAHLFSQLGYHIQAFLFTSCNDCVFHYYNLQFDIA